MPVVDQSADICSVSLSEKDEKQIAVWSLETEIAKDGPAARVGGKWRVTAATFSTRDEARALTRVLRSSGYPAEVSGAGGAFTVAISALAGESEARALMASLRNVKGVGIPTINEVP